jgi:hypothetical protein
MRTAMLAWGSSFGTGTLSRSMAAFNRLDLHSTSNSVVFLRISG